MDKEILSKRLMIVEQEIRRINITISENTALLHELHGVHKELNFLLNEYYKDQPVSESDQ